MLGDRDGILLGAFEGAEVSGSAEGCMVGIEIVGIAVGS